MTGQSLWARRSCFNCATSFLRRVTSFCWQHNTYKQHTFWACTILSDDQGDWPSSVIKWKIYTLDIWRLTVRETFMLARSSAFFSKELTHSFRFCLQREAAALFLSRKRCLLSSGSISEARRRRPPVGWAGDTLGKAERAKVITSRLHSWVWEWGTLN